MLEEIERWDKEARELRRRGVDWDRVNRLPPRLRAAIKYYIETGEIRVASRLAGLPILKFRELLRELKVPVVS